MNTVTDEEYHITFGLHSGIPLCCVLAFAEHGKGGPCPKCISAGVTKKDIFSKLHWCDENTPACQPYLDLVEMRIVHYYKERVHYPKQGSLTKGEVDDYTWGCSVARPLGDNLRDLLQSDGFRMVHLCWPDAITYWYVYQQVGGKKGKCGICNTKFSLAFPTAGKQF